MIKLYKLFVVNSFDFNNLIVKSMVIFFHEISNNFIIYIVFIHVVY